ncbi:MAG TPA: hypothetical protein VIP11_12605 [Gemmatimonadaceae bacterium]
MASLRAELSLKLDVSTLVQGFVGDVAGPAGQLTAIADPTPASGLADVNSQIDGLSLDSLGSSVSVITDGAASIVASLPIAGDIVKPVTDVLAAIETLTSADIGDLPTRIRSLLGDLSGILEGPREGGVLGALHAAAEALGGAQEGSALTSLIGRLTAASGISMPSLPITDGIKALDGAVRVVGGLMVLDAVTADVERLTRLMAARLDPRALDRELTALEAELTFDGVELADAMAAVDADDAEKVARIAAATNAAAAALDRLHDEFTAAMGLGEATLVYLDVNALAAELETGRTLIRTGDLAPLNRICTQIAGGVQPFLRQDLLEGPTQDLDALFADAEAKLADIAARITAIDVASFVDPLADGMALITAPIDRVTELLDQVRVMYQGALGTVRDAVAALPIKAIADAIHAVLDPIADVIEAVRQLVLDVVSALQLAADTVTDALDGVEGLVDNLQNAVDSLFGEVKAFLDSLHLDQALGAVEENIRKLATALEQARMEPYFDTAAEAIDTAADVIDAVPFDLLPESMKADVDAAVAPIKNADAAALETEIESLLQITPDGHFAILDEVDAAVASMQESFDALIAEVRAHDPRIALAEVDTKLHELSEQIAQLSPSLALQPVRDAIDRVKATIASLDVDAPLAPVREAFATIIDGVNQFKPSTLIGGVEDRITAAREQVVNLLHLPEIEQGLDDVHTRAVDLLDRYDADLIQERLEALMEEFLALAENTPKLQLMGGLGAIVAGLLNGMGLRVYPHSFESVLRWLGGASASAELNQRMASAGEAVAAAKATVDSLNFQGGGRVPTVVARVIRARAAIEPLKVRLGDSPAVASLAAAEPRLDAAGVFAFLDTNRARFAASLGDATNRIQVIAQAGFSDADVRITNLIAATAPLDPARSYVRRLLQRLGLTGFELGLAGVLRAFLAIVPPSRLVGLVRPIFDALKGRVQALVDAVLAPLKAGVASVRAALDAIDLAPLIEALDAIHAEVLSQIQALSPDALLGPILGEVNALKETLTTADPLDPVLDILNAVRDAVSRVLAKLSLEKILATPLAIYDELLTELSRLDIAALIAPLRAQLDDIAKQVDEGLDKTVVSFQRLQAALPSGGGGSSVDVSVEVG